MENTYVEKPGQVYYPRKSKSCLPIVIPDTQHFFSPHSTYLLSYTTIYIRVACQFRHTPNNRAAMILLKKLDQQQQYTQEPTYFEPTNQYPGFRQSQPYPQQQYQAPQQQYQTQPQMVNVQPRPQRPSPDDKSSCLACAW